MGWYSRLSTGKLSFYRAIPKAELHRHLEGSLRLETLLDVARQHELTIPYAHFNSLVQMQQGDPLTFSNFLSKFQTLRMFYRSPEVISRITREAIMDAASDGVRYLELRFTPVALSRLQGFSYGEVIDWVLQSSDEASRDFNVNTRLIVSVNRHEPVEIAEQVIRHAIDRKDRGIVGVDLAGSEASNSALPFAGIFNEARQCGLHLTVHAGEWGGPLNVREAIEILQAERIGHGVRVVEDREVLALAAERGTYFEVCITSNYQSGVVTSPNEHPLPTMIAAGLKTTLNTDDPGISRITLTDEYRIAMEEIGLSRDTICNCVLNGALGSFQTPAEKQLLYQGMESGLKAIFQSD